MVELCENHGVQLVLMKAPSLYPYWYDEWEVQMEEYAAAKGVEYINFLELTDEMSIDFNTDTYDSGLHLNLYGAEKMSHWFGQWLNEHTDVEDRRGQQPYEDIWNAKSAAYTARKVRLEAEWAAEQQAAGKE